MLKRNRSTREILPSTANNSISTTRNVKGYTRN